MQKALNYNTVHLLLYASIRKCAAFNGKRIVKLNTIQTLNFANIKDMRNFEPTSLLSTVYLTFVVTMPEVKFEIIHSKIKPV